MRRRVERETPKLDLANPTQWTNTQSHPLFLAFGDPFSPIDEFSLNIIEMNQDVHVALAHFWLTRNIRAVQVMLVTLVTRSSDTSLKATRCHSETRIATSLSSVAILDTPSPAG